MNSHNYCPKCSMYARECFATYTTVASVSLTLAGDGTVIDEEFEHNDGCENEVRQCGECGTELVEVPS